jgi:hypothetical protein
VIEVHRDGHPASGIAAVLIRLTVSGNRGVDVRGEVDETKLVGADRYLEEARIALRNGFVAKDRLRTGAGGVLDRGDAGGVVFRLVIAGRRTRIRPVGTIRRVEFPRGRVANAESRAVLDRHVGVEKTSHLDDEEEDEQNQWQDQRELDQALTSKPLVVI